MDFCRNMPVSGGLPSEFMPETAVSQESSQLDDLFPGENKELHFELEWLSVFLEDCFSGSGYQCQLPPPGPGPARADAGGPAQSRPAQAHPGGPLLGLVGRLPGRPRSRRERRGRVPSAPREEEKERAERPARADAVGAMQGRRCTHCMAQRTPQWRAGPKGPKTLCNVCGVRFKSGRLLPEYRPAKSPTFLSDRHSNSHKKVMEMRMAM